MVFRAIFHTDLFRYMCIYIMICKSCLYQVFACCIVSIKFMYHISFRHLDVDRHLCDFWPLLEHVILPWTFSCFSEDIFFVKPCKWFSGCWSFSRHGISKHSIYISLISLCTAMIAHWNICLYFHQQHRRILMSPHLWSVFDDTWFHNSCQLDCWKIELFYFKLHFSDYIHLRYLMIIRFLLY